MFMDKSFQKNLSEKKKTDKSSKIVTAAVLLHSFNRSKNLTVKLEIDLLYSRLIETLQYKGQKDDKNV